MKKNKYIFVAIAVMVLLGGGSIIYAQPDIPHLVLLTEPEPMVSFFARVPIKVRYLDVDDRPIPDAFISFAPQSETADTNLSRLNASTNDDGVAETFIEAGGQQVDFDILISVSRDDDVLPLTVHVRVAPAGDRLEVNYPSEEFRSIQDAINALADGGTLKIAKGVFEIEPTFIRGKTVHIEGKGADCKNIIDKRKKEKIKKQRGKSSGTVLISPLKDTVVAPDEVRASFHFIDAGGSIRNLKLIGGDAGIASRETASDSSKPVEVSDTCITDTGRGIHWKSTAPLTVSDTVFYKIRWNGISISPSLIFSPPLHTLQNVFYKDLDNFCIYIENAAAAIINDYLVNCNGGGIAASQSTIWVDDTLIINAKKAGIWLDASYGDLYNNIILGTDADPNTGHAGDGVVAWGGSTVYIFETNIELTERAAVSNFGSYIAVGDNHFRCQSIDLNGEVYNNLAFQFDDLLDNLCGCPIANGPCAAVSSTLEPPPPVGGLE